MQACGLSHSDGDNLPMIKNDKETPKYDPPKNNHTPLEKGDIKENISGSPFVGLRYNMDIPRFINGIVKSTALSKILK